MTRRVWQSRNSGEGVRWSGVCVSPILYFASFTEWSSLIMNSEKAQKKHNRFEMSHHSSHTVSLCHCWMIGNDTFTQTSFILLCILHLHRLSNKGSVPPCQRRQLSYAITQQRQSSPFAHNRQRAAVCPVAMSFTITCQSMSGDIWWIVSSLWDEDWMPQAEMLPIKGRSWVCGAT